MGTDRQLMMLLDVVAVLVNGNRRDAALRGDAVVIGDAGHRVAAVPVGAWQPLELHATLNEAPPIRQPMLADRLAQQLKPVPPAFALSPGADAFVWQTGGSAAALLGTNPRSTLFGVYDLLEELGCRFFSPDPDDEHIPRLNDHLFEQPRERFEQAAFAYRERHLLEWIDVEATRREIDHAAKRRMNGFAFHIEDFAPNPQSWRVVLDDLVPEIARRCQYRRL